MCCNLISRSFAAAGFAVERFLVFLLCFYCHYIILHISLHKKMLLCQFQSADQLVHAELLRAMADAIFNYDCFVGVVCYIFINLWTTAVTNAGLSMVDCALFSSGCRSLLRNKFFQLTTDWLVKAFYDRLYLGRVSDNLYCHVLRYCT